MTVLKYLGLDTGYKDIKRSENVEFDDICNTVIPRLQPITLSSIQGNPWPYHGYKTIALQRRHLHRFSFANVRNPSRISLLTY